MEIHGIANRPEYMKSPPGLFAMSVFSMPHGSITNHWLTVD